MAEAGECVSVATVTKVNQNGDTELIKMRDLRKVYRMGATEVHALAGLDLLVTEGELLSIMGPSGSGKSTLMAIIGCLDVPTEGTYILGDEDVGALNDNQLAEIRSRRIGFIFQQFNLLARTSALENVMLPLVYAGVPRRERKDRAIDALKKVGLGDRVKHKPNELSGGQQQRVAIARALANNPSILLADEPTGAVDTHTGDEIMALFQELNENEGITVCIVTHDPEVATITPRVVYLRDGLIESDGAQDVYK